MSSTDTAGRINRRRLLQATANAGLLTTTGSVGAAATDAATPAQDPPLTDVPLSSLFGNFIGTCQADANVGAVSELGGMAWNRQDFAWGTWEPSKGEFNDEWLELWLSRYATKPGGVTTLPILDYTANWAARRDPYEFDHRGKHYSFGPVLSETDTKCTRRRVITDGDGNPIDDAEASVPKKFTPPQDVADWEAFVDGAVTALRADPYNVEYFQIWNEGYYGSSFWFSGMDDYMQTIHNPAARIIRKHGGKVVYGGWPPGVSLKEFSDLLSSHDAWELVDVLDVHYDPLPAMDYLLNESRNHVRGGLAVWQTEQGFVPDGNLGPNRFPKAFHWALRHELARKPDAFKLWWFSWTGSSDPNAFNYNRSLHNGAELSHHGKALATLADLLGGNRVTTFSDFRTTPLLQPELDETLSSAEGFRVGGSLVLAIHLARQSEANILWDSNGDFTALHLAHFDPELVIRLDGLRAARTASRVDIFGNRRELTARRRDGALEVVVPVQDDVEEVQAVTSDAEVRTFYIVIEP